MKKVLLSSIFLTSFICCLTFFACHTQKCTQFVKYQGTSVDIKALKGVLGKYVDLSAGEVSIDPSFRDVSDSLMSFDMRQNVICTQIKSLSNRRDRDAYHKKWIEMLMGIYDVAKNPVKYNDSIKAINLKKKIH